MSKRLLTLFLTCGALLAASVVSAQDATITGRVADDAGEPLVGANVFIEATNLGSATDENGNYRFVVPASRVNGQEVRLTARFIGYRHKTQRVVLNPGTITQDFVLAEDVLKMDAIIVTGVVDETPKEKLAFTVGSLDEEQLQRAPASNPADALRGKIAGVKVVSTSGQPGSSPSVQLRAPTSINASGRSQDPLYIIDGVIIDPSITGSPLGDIPAEDIVSMEVVKGAAGASLYGSRASNGVIVIKTNRGGNLGLNQTRIRFRNEFGANNIERDIGISQYHPYVVATSSYTDARGRQVTPGDYIDANGNWIDPRSDRRVLDRYTASPQGSGIAFHDKEYKYVETGGFFDFNTNLWTIERTAAGDSIAPSLLPGGQLFDHLDRLFDPGQFINNTVSLSRNMEQTNFFVSFQNYFQTGAIDGIDGLDRKSVRMNLDHKFMNVFDFSASGFFSQSGRELVDEGLGGPFFGLTFTSPAADLLKRDSGGELFVQPDPIAVEENPIYLVQNNNRRDDRKRVQGSFDLRYRPTNAFNVEASLSYDRSDRDNALFWPVGFRTVDASVLNAGRLFRSSNLDEALNGSVTASYSRAFGQLTLRTKARALFERVERRGHNGQGTTLAVGGVNTNLGIAAQQVIGSFEQTIRSEGYSFIAALDFKDRYIVDFLVRRDGSSLFGADQRWHTYYRASGAYRLSQEPWWFLPFFQEFKLRGSYGTAGGRPTWSARFETLTVSQGSVSKSTLGNTLLKPEFVKELEVGVDAAFLNRFSLEFSYARTQAEDQILFVPLPGYFGFVGQWQNAGTLETNVLEASLTASVLQSRNTSLSLGVNFDRARQEITKLDVPSYTYSPPGTQDQAVFFIAEGEDYGALYGERFLRTLDDLPPGLPQDQFQLNDDGYVVWVGQGRSYRDGISGELWGTRSGALRDDFGNSFIYDWGIPVRGRNEDGTLFQRIGSIVPDFNLGFSANFRWKGVSVYGLMDAQVGGDVYNQTYQWAFRDSRSIEYDQSGKPDELKKPNTYYRALYSTRNPTSHFVEDGGYLKLRELSVRYSFNKRQLSGVLGGFLNNVSVGFIGRNLFTFFTDYRAFDPEVGIGGGQGGSAAVNRFDNFGYPNYRTYNAVLEFEF